ncbi:hybrid sensor histidine kinase/response regulator [Corallococcus sp. AB004]|uniref:hybrid sensor histidine kinase/response regulator n=1 Tax=Corallococcus TaxID=83461 RepID=UPI000EA1665F|nr:MULTISPECIES: response regulator [Corallococcus]RKI47917.1 hybrid sensor histidine kinase/response regulator [Corallococcus sp. AB004]NPC68481.1 response regulator [Corallococcus exiguus]NPD22503.1 response regulator [Corallococcus exiguus]NRD47329.1 response regulator [Corallococcus exiguus]RKH96157.1 hybrid sensor histidine kinase/response regulator [Corallococcus sp. AB038B]
MDPQLLRSIWPVFAAETREQIQAIGSKVLGLEQPASARDADLMPSLKRVVHSLKGSAASLGLDDIERIVHAIEDGLSHVDVDQPISRGAVEAMLRGLSAIENALNRGDAGEQPVVDGVGSLLKALGHEEPAAPGSDDAAINGPLGEDGLKALVALETALSTLVSPKVEDRAGAVRSAVDQAHALRQIAEAVQADAVATLAEAAALGFTRMEEGGDAAGLAASEVAGALVDLRMALSLAEEAVAVREPEPVNLTPAPAAKPAARASTPAPEGRAGTVDRAVRVSVKTLDSLALQVEHLVSGRSQQGRRTEGFRSLTDQAHEVLLHLERAASQLAMSGGGSALEPLRTGVGLMRTMQKRLLEHAKEAHRDGEQQSLVAQVIRDDLRDLRMVPASQVLEPLRRTVRETASRLGKEVALELGGTDVRLDRRIVDALKDPLVHLVRNAIDHGLEMPAERKAAGKQETGRLVVRVEARGTRIGVIVEDDGAGLDPVRVRATAVRRGLMNQEAADKLSDAQAARLIFQPGFSTRDEVTSTSGRGVGLDVVLATAQRLQGSADVEYTPGKGTRFIVDLPLTLAAALGLLVRTGTTVTAIPSDTVKRVLRLDADDVGTVAGRVVARLDGEQLTFLSLSEAIGLPRMPLALESGRRQTAVLLSLGEERVLYAIDEVVGQQELVVRALGKHLRDVTHLAGAAVLDDGRVVPVLNAPELLRAAKPDTRTSGGESKLPRILVCDDSLTTRFAMKSLLEIAGYPVVTASDGEEAWQVLERVHCHLVVSDWQMPRLDGVGLARRIKGHPMFRRTPIILVTSLDSNEDRAAGLEAGADGYLVKREVERGKLLELVRQLLPG